jgi:hypothetical protein
MKNKLVLFFLAILFSLGLSAQGFSSVKEAADIAKLIVKTSGKPANFAITAARVPNAVAVIHNDKRYVLYNPYFINRISAYAGTPWAAVSILAHEIGHHLMAGSGTSSTKLASELEADEFSGFVLQKLGASLEEAQAAMSLIGSEKASRTHPAKADRLSSIAEGWNEAAEEAEATTETGNVGYSANNTGIATPR